MQLEQFIAESAADAVAQIRAKLGPDSIVVNVRELPRRRWQKPRIEVIAHKPQAASADGEATGDRVGPRLENAPARIDSGRAGAWRIGPVLENLGFLPRHAERVVDELRVQHGDTAPESLAQEIPLARSVLLQLWPSRRPVAVTDVHVFVGAPGVGKTTALCKWLTQAVLLDGRRARVWRLDGRTANTGESLSVHGDILGVPVERSWTGEPLTDDMAFVDLPGASAAGEVMDCFAQWPTAQVHLVLNAAYETSVMLAQVRAFSALPIADLIVTHLDEETRWGKLWNLVLGTNCAIRFLGAGQNIPGEFQDATPEKLLHHDFPMN